jgi:amino acid transporter
MSEEAANATRAVPYGILMSIGSCWLFGWILVIVIAACMSPDLASLTGTKFGQPMAQIYYDSIGKSGAIGLMTLLFIVQFLMVRCNGWKSSLRTHLPLWRHATL